MEMAEIKITRRKLRSLVNDSKRSAKAINLIYVNDTQPGIRRIRTEEGFIYKLNNRKISSKAELMRIKRLVIPPAWENVWICPFANGHLQVTGTDVRGRKQYKYHPLWNNLRNHTKFTNLRDFGFILPAIRKRLQKDLSLPGLPQEKVLAAAVSIMQCTCIRVGNSMYEKLYGSFGLTTLKDQHVNIKGSTVKFSFKGKKGIYHDITLKSKKLARIVQQCKDIPGKELFQYFNENGERRSIDSGMVNSYIKQISGGNFTAKDFRTWMGTLQALAAFRQFGCCETITETKRKIVEALDMVAKHLGNTRAVCKKYYVHPVLIDMYSDKTLNKYLRDIDHSNCAELTELDREEQILMKILESHASSVIIN